MSLRLLSACETDSDVIVALVVLPAPVALQWYDNARLDLALALGLG